MEINVSTLNPTENVTGRKVSLKENIGFGLGDMACNFVYACSALYMTYFYTDIFGLSSVAVGTLFLVVRILDAIINPVIGFIVDKTNSRWGKLRPYILFGAVPLGLLNILCFTTPNFSGTGKLIYAYLTYTLLCFAYSAVNVPYSALNSSITQDPNERTKLTSFRMLLANAGWLLVSTFILPLAKFLGGDNKANGFQYSVIFFSTAAIILLFICFATTKEEKFLPQKYEKAKKQPFKKQLGVILKNKPLLIFSALIFMFNIGSLINSSVTMYYFKYNLQREDLIPVFMLISTLAVVAGVCVCPKIIKIAGKKKVMAVSLVGQGLFSAALFFTPYNQIIMIFFWSVMMGFMIAAFDVAIWGMLSDTVEYGEYKTGIRAEGLIFSFFYFCIKVSSALGGALLGAILLYIGYKANTVQTEFALDGLLTCKSILVTLISLISLIILKFYKLDEKVHASIVSELKISE